MQAIQGVPPPIIASRQQAPPIITPAKCIDTSIVPVAVIADPELLRQIELLPYGRVAEDVGAVPPSARRARRSVGETSSVQHAPPAGHYQSGP